MKVECLLGKVMENIINFYCEKIKQGKQRYEKAVKLQMDVWNGKRAAGHPLLLKCELNGDLKNKIPDYNYKEIHYDSQKMLLFGLKQAMYAVEGNCEAVPSVRANMGCGIFANFFGLEQDLFEDKMPWLSQKLTKEEIMNMVPEDLKPGDQFKKGLEHMDYMADKLEGTGCLIFPMDLQGPYDMAHLVYGDNIFYDMYDDPEFVHHVLDLSCHAIIMGMEACLNLIPGSENMVAHYNDLVIPADKGGIKISEDTSTLISKEQIEEFVIPYTRRILKHFGGGYIHYCGRNDHLLNAIMNEPLALGLNLGNPEMHDMEEIVCGCAKNKKVYYGLIPGKEGETYEQYFKRYLNASQNDGVYWLLLQYNCNSNNHNKIKESWIGYTSSQRTQV